MGAGKHTQFALIRSFCSESRPSCLLGADKNKHTVSKLVLSFLIFQRSSIGGVAYVTLFNSSATWVVTFRHVVVNLVSSWQLGENKNTHTVNLGLFVVDLVLV